MVLVLSRSEALALALELLERVLILLSLRGVLRSDAPVELELKGVVVVVGHATHVFVDDVGRRFELGGVFNLLSIQSCPFSFECVESIVVIRILRGIHIHLLLWFWFALGLLVPNGSIEFHLKEGTRQ